MNYFAIYKALIQKAQNTVKTGYVERHHIIPKSLGGTDVSDNLVFLTAREHFIAHRLLEKMYKGKMISAIWFMCCDDDIRRYKTTSRTYGYVREKVALQNSEDMKLYWKNNPERKEMQSKEWSLNNPKPSLRKEVSEKISKKLKGKTWVNRYGEEISRKKKEMYSLQRIGVPGKKLSQEHKEIIRERNSKAYVLISPENKVYHIKNLNKFCRENNLNQSICRVPTCNKIGWIGYIADDYKQMTHEQREIDIKKRRTPKIVIHSEETKAKIRKTLTNRHPTKETRKKMSVSHMGKKRNVKLS